ncbi:MAG: hypothetical protein V4682_00840 [Patescibacteria group bacterium]
MTKPLTTVKGASGTYRVSKRLGGTEKFTLYQCQQDGTEAMHILKIATEARFNGAIDREAFLLRDMRERAAALEAEYAAVKKGPELLNYGISFPILIETFIAKEQGRRRIMVMSFEGVTDITKLVPMSHITTRDRVYVDPRTSAWMLGKLLKLLIFAHDQGIVVGNLDGDNILVERDQHYVVLFDWTTAVRYDSGIPPDVVGKEIAHAAQAVLRALGANPKTGALPESDQLNEGGYQAHLLQLITGKSKDAAHAHADFYGLIRGLWPRSYYPYTTNPL